MLFRLLLLVSDVAVNLGRGQRFCEQAPSRQSPPNRRFRQAINIGRHYRKAQRPAQALVDSLIGVTASEPLSCICGHEPWDSCHFAPFLEPILLLGRNCVEELGVGVCCGGSCCGGSCWKLQHLNDGWRRLLLQHGAGGDGMSDRGPTSESEARVPFASWTTCTVCEEELVILFVRVDSVESCLHFSPRLLARQTGTRHEAYARRTRGTPFR